MTKRTKVQQALLKPAYARLYPGIPANEWRPVAVMLELYRVSRQKAGAPGAPEEHELNPEHFAFRGTASEGSKDADRESRTEGRRTRRPK